MKQVNIYALVDPTTKTVRYVGKTQKELSIRLLEHLEPARLKHHTYKNHWINSLLTSGLKPEIVLIKQVEGNDWQFWEQYYISIYENLTNSTKGGDGLNKPTQDVKDKIGAANSKRIIQYSLEGQFLKVWDSATKAARFYNLKSTTISSAASPNNRKQSSCGFLWRIHTQNFPRVIPAYTGYRGRAIKNLKP